MPCMGGERASTTRMRRSGKIRCNCGAILPPPAVRAVRGERKCYPCAKERSPRRRVYMYFMLSTGWYCQFLEADLKTPLALKVTIRDENKLFEMAGRGGFKMTPEARQTIQ